MNNTVRVTTTTSNRLQRDFSTIGDDFGVDFTAFYKDPENLCFAVCASAMWVEGVILTLILMILLMLQWISRGVVIANTDGVVTLLSRERITF